MRVANLLSKVVKCIAKSIADSTLLGACSRVSRSNKAIVSL